MERISSRFAGSSYEISIKVPPLKSRPKVNPLKPNVRTEIEKRAIEKIPAILRNFMNGIGLFIRP